MFRLKLNSHNGCNKNTNNSNNKKQPLSVDSTYQLSFFLVFFFTLFFFLKKRDEKIMSRLFHFAQYKILFICAFHLLLFNLSACASSRTMSFELTKQQNLTEEMSKLLRRSKQNKNIGRKSLVKIHLALYKKPPSRHSMCGNYKCVQRRDGVHV